MANARDLVIRFIGDTSSLDKGFAKAQGESEKTAGHFGKLHTAAKLAGTVIEGGLAVALEKSVEAAKDAQASQLQMENQLKSVGIAYKAHSAEIKDSIEKTSELAAFTETDLRGSFTNLVRTTGNVKQALADSALAADVARGKGISLAAATQLVTKAELGKAGALTKAGIEAKKVTTAEDALKQKIVALHAAHVKFTPALQAHIDKMKEAAKVSDLNATKAGLLATLHQKFAGAAKTYGESAAGAQEKFKVALEELEVKLGTAVLPVMTKFENILVQILGWLEKHQTVMKVLIAAVGVFGAALIGINVALKAYEIATKIATAAQAVFNFVLSANPIGVVVLALAALAGAIYIAWTHSETFRRIVLGVWADVKGAVTGAINFITVKVPEAFEHVLAWARAHWPIIATIISGPFFPLVALATNAFGIRSAIVGAFEGIKTKVVSLVGDVIDFMKTSFSTVGKVLRALVVAPIDAVIAAWNAFHIPSIHIGFDTHIPGVGKVGFDTPDIGFPNIPLLAQGGIVTRPTLAVVGEAGPEAVVPLSRGGGLGGTTIVVNVAGSVVTQQQLEDAIYRGLLRRKQRTGDLGLA